MIRNAVWMAVAIVVAFALHGCAQPGVGGGNAAAQRENLQTRLADLIVAYEAEDFFLVEGRIDRNMIGYQRFIDGVRTDFDRHGQIRIILVDTESTVENGAGVIHTRFEKRFVRTNDAVAGLVAGRTTILFRNTGGDWVITGIGGDNPFTAPVGSP